MKCVAYPALHDLLIIDMEIPYQLLILSITSLILIGIYCRRVGESWRSVFASCLAGFAIPNRKL
jgi:hypothetical protein